MLARVGDQPRAGRAEHDAALRQCSRTASDHPQRRRRGRLRVRHRADPPAGGVGHDGAARPAQARPPGQGADRPRGRQRPDDLAALTGVHRPGRGARGRQARDRRGRRARASLRGTVAVDAGTTTYAAVQALPDAFRGTVVTHSVPVMQLCSRGASGGSSGWVASCSPRARRSSDRGPSTAVAGLRVQTLLLGAAAVDERGIYVSTDNERPTKLALMSIADRVVLLVDSSKFLASAPVHLCGWDEISAVVTDAPPPATWSRGFPGWRRSSRSPGRARALPPPAAHRTGPTSRWRARPTGPEGGIQARVVEQLASGIETGGGRGTGP